MTVPTPLSSRRAPPARSRPRPAHFRSLDDVDTLRALVQNIGEGIYITDAQGRILDCNPAFLRLMGVDSLDALADYSAADLHADPSRRAVEMELIDQDGGVREFELELVRPDGARRTVLDTTYRCRDPESGETLFHGIIVDITRRKELENRLREQSVRDVLTGSFNRQYLEELGRRFGPESDAMWGCIYIDVDDFGRYNEQHGREDGDRVLVKMARFLMGHVRSEEAVMRVGADEFLIVLTGEGGRRAEQVGTRLQVVATTHAPAAFSIGCAVRLPGESLDNTVARAEQRLTAVRVTGRAGPEERRTPTGLALVE